MINQGLFLSKTVEWATPQALFDRLNKIYHFSLDPCSTVENAKCSKFFTVETNGLEQSWDNENVFMNPPYGREIGQWVRKASEARGGVVVCLLPARTDTKWFHEYIYRKADVHFVRGRVKFGDATNSAPFPSMIVIFNNL